MKPTSRASKFGRRLSSALPIMAALCAFVLSSCNTPLNVFGTSVALVNNRAPDGSYITPTSPAGAPATKSATIYEFKDSTFGVSLWSDGTAPLLSSRR